MSLNSDKALSDVAIVGAGPAGLAAALYTARSGLKTLVFGDPYSSQLAKAGIVENYLTYPQQIQGLAITERMIDHATKWGAQLIEGQIRQITRDGDTFSLVTAQNECYNAYTVIIATGSMYRKLGVSGEDEFYGKGVSYCTLCDGALYIGQPVAMVGHDSEAAVAALRLSGLASRVTFLVDRPRLSAEVPLKERLEQTPNLDLCLGTRIEAIEGDETGVQKVHFKSQHEFVEAAVKAVFIEIGTLPSSALAQDLGVELSGQFIKVGSGQETNIPGVFAAGDVTGIRARQAAISVGDGTQAAVAVIDYIKSLGVSAEKSRLRSVQWGTLSPVTQAATPAEVSEEAHPVKNPLREYIARDEAFLRNYDNYEPRLNVVEQVAQALPQARIVTVSAFWCPDCRRNVPKMAKIAEHLPGWTFEVYADKAPEASEKYQVKAIPTFIVYQGDKEIGRIVENPVRGSLEDDLLAIVSARR